MICLACHKPLLQNEKLYHLACLKEFWQEDEPVFELDYSTSQIEELAKENIAQRIIVTGVQPKLSLGFDEANTRLTIVGALNGRFILKLPNTEYPQMPEIEALSMCLAKACGIDTVPFLLITLKGGELSYLTKRIDRVKEHKLAMEDACQFTNQLTADKYESSYEKIAKAINQYAYNPLISVVRFYEQVIVSFLIGNNDMHLKNFSLMAKQINKYELAPLYDMISAQLLLPEDKDELALHLNGKKRKLKKEDFNQAMLRAKIPEKAIQNLWKRIEKGTLNWTTLIDNSFLTFENKEKFKELIGHKKQQLA
jgi:serine/threonine-protein kinase HipA